MTADRDDQAEIIRELREEVRRLRDEKAAFAGREKVLLQAASEREAIDRLKDDIQSTVSHELKTPLVAGMGYVELVLKGGLGPLNQDQRRGLDISYKNLQRLSNLVDDVLVFNRLRARTEAMTMAPFSFPELLREAVADARWRSLDRPIRASVECPPDLPTVFGDRDMVARVVWCLLSNAEKFASEAAVQNGTAFVRVRAVVRDSRIEVEVEDNGIGMPSDVRDRPFERFRQGDPSTTRRYSGIGLGLALAKEIVDAHGCAIAIRSTEGKGTTAIFGVPLSVQPGASQVLATPKGAAKTASILVIDDEPDIIEFIKAVFRHTGYRARYATSGAAGLSLVAESAPDLVLLDLAMEEMDGLEVCRRIKNNPATARVPVHILSARSEETAVQEALAAGASGFITKPFRIQDFLRRVEEAVSAGSRR